MVVTNAAQPGKSEIYKSSITIKCDDHRKAHLCTVVENIGGTYSQVSMYRANWKLIWSCEWIT